MRRSNAVTAPRNLNAEQALRGAIVNSRRSPGAPLREQRSGRLDRRRLAKVGVGDLRVFTAKRAQRPSKVRVTILVDASSSMRGLGGSWRQNAEEREQSMRNGSLVNIAARTCRNLAGATEMLDWVTANAVAFTTGGPGVLMGPLWKSGEDTGQIPDRMDRIRMGGTEEGYALAMAADDMKENLRPGEQALVIILSDGGPSEPRHVKWMVERMAADNIPVVSVALTESAEQPLMYGKHNVVTYSNNPRKLAKDMAKVIGRAL